MKNIIVERALKNMGQSLTEARLKRSCTQRQVSTFLNTSTETIARLEEGDGTVSMYFFFGYVFFLHLDISMIKCIEECEDRIIFEIENRRIIKTSEPVIRFANRIMSRIIIIKKFIKISNETISNKTGIDVFGINKIENIDRDVTLYMFFLYCNSLNIVSCIVDSLSFKHDEIGNKYVMEMIYRKMEKEHVIQQSVCRKQRYASNRRTVFSSRQRRRVAGVQVRRFMARRRISD